MSDRVFNFSAGPAVLPLEVLKEAQSNFLNHQGTGANIMEQSHRGPVFDKIIQEAEADLRTLIGIPDDYAVLFVSGGASFQFSAIPLNLCKDNKKVQYIQTGTWSKTAAEEAKRLGICDVDVIFNDTKRVPTAEEIKAKVDPEAAYLYYCDNETIQGVEFQEVPEAPIPVIADMSSNFLSRPIDIKKYGMVYACAQKNFGPAGLTVVVIRKDLIKETFPFCPNLLRYSVLEANRSMKNTPPTYAIYIAGLVFKWIMSKGGLPGIGELNRTKAMMIYDTIAQSNGFWNVPAEETCRSMMNIPFTNTLGQDRAKEFMAFAKERNCVTLAGHRSIGGFRASIYNSMPVEGVEALVQAMKDYQQANQ
ncbi:Phosphoserine aminotransferase [Carpediemonas membranifera]|uniref:Phosphoserine aminotransferase n=1 Tax=Carpediemonas membranifera TaxID=201153 RepID=A0A8J6BES0_9EUKA|nr:Phosphoserine aminotransferase [Carpediemonas membranifera]|eukprot:KAG9395937.1 Phosphoserine aminotransferase [Carpediemonas membranifera]